MSASIDTASPLTEDVLEEACQHATLCIVKAVRIATLSGRNDLLAVMQGICGQAFKEASEALEAAANSGTVH